ncbi:uncharacterized protein PgNI_03567 [Pyricularia grisea]|uniref:AB hydrolase-1 domain-containing protein n=1 Tax=Pyricularia grisea TaxID=148305 RepID=A0A6P8BEV8_PYRGI|nr:uncharacterized protein PgNI_03567 [Pyricularia grisea]TLD14378.1 hypothetical protein PgNI_03567 [Pyricularia grisea]
MIQPHLDAGREAERQAKGRDGGVKAVIFIASLIVLPGGISLAEHAGGLPTETWYETVDGALVLNPGAEKIFYNDFNETKAMEAIKNTKCQPSRLLTHNKDACISPAVLNMLADGLGDKYTKVSLNYGHTPWMRNYVLPELVNVIVGAARA